MSWAEDTKLRLKFAAIGLAFMCPGFLIWMAGEAVQQIRSYSWPSTDGTVQAVVAKPYVDKKEMMYFGRVVYDYSVNGIHYTSELTDLGTGRKRDDRSEALADYGMYIPGMSVTIYYDPSDPGIAVLEKGIPGNYMILLVGLTVGSVVGICSSVFIIRGWVHSFRRPAEQSKTTH